MRYLTIVALLAGALFVSLPSTPAALHAQSVTKFTGPIPRPDSTGLLVTTAGVAAADLVLAVQASGCDVAAVAVLEGGRWLVYIPAAPAQINAHFPASLGPTTAFFVRCGSSATSVPPVGEPRRWAGTGRGSTGHFSTGSGDWEFCATIEANSDQNSGARFSLYTGADLWVASDSGKGGPGPVGCTPIPASSGQFEIRVFALDSATWSLVLRPRGGPSLVGAELPYWSSAPTAIAPFRADSEGVWFQSDHSEVTGLFRVSTTEWTMCFLLHASSTDTTVVGSPFMSFSVLFEDEPGRVGEGRVPSELLVNGTSACAQVRVPQPGRYRLLVDDGVPASSWTLVVRGATAN